jgi:hypothetical protein
LCCYNRIPTEWIIYNEQKYIWLILVKSGAAPSRKKCTETMLILAAPIRQEKEVKGYKWERRRSNYPNLQII